MGAKTLKTACLGLNLQAQEFLNVAAESEFFDIVAVAGNDIASAQKIAQQYGCVAFDDYRQLVVQNQLDALFVALPLCECAEYVHLAISKKCNILKLVPTALSFDEAAELIQSATKNDVKYITACSSRFAPPFVAMRDYITEIGTEGFHFINVFYNTSQSKVELSDSGVLLNDCFEIIDAIVLHFSLPQQLYALVTNQAPDRKQRQYMPEETVAITMQFAGGLIGSFVAGKAINAGPWSIAIHGRENHIIVAPNRFRVYDKENQLLNDRHFSTSNEKKELLNDFAQSILFPAEHKLRYESFVDLATMAFIDSTYLSAKTAMPEMPQRIFEISKNRIVAT